MLTMLVSMRRTSDISHMTVDNYETLPNKLVFHLDVPVKNYNNRNFHQAKSLQTMTIKAYKPDKNLCPVETLKQYIKTTSHIRKSRFLFVHTKTPFSQVSSATFRRWIVDTLENAGIVGYSAHSVRNASSSKAFFSGFSLKQVAFQAGWSTLSTFIEHYLQPINNKKSNNTQHKTQLERTKQTVARAKEICNLKLATAASTSKALTQPTLTVSPQKDSAHEESFQFYPTNTSTPTKAVIPKNNLQRQEHNKLT